MKKPSITASKFDEKFDCGEDIVEYLDLKNITKPGNEPKRVNVDFPSWMVMELDKIANKLGVTRQSVIKIFISEKLGQESQ